MSRHYDRNGDLILSMRDCEELWDALLALFLPSRSSDESRAKTRNVQALVARSVIFNLNVLQEPSPAMGAFIEFLVTRRRAELLEICSVEPKMLESIDYFRFCRLGVAATDHFLVTDFQPWLATDFLPRYSREDPDRSQARYLELRRELGHLKN